MHLRDRFPFCSSLRRLVALAIIALGPLLRADDLTLFSDEFDSSASIANWHRIYQTEGWGNNALQTLDINTTSAGRMVMIPHSSSWYEEFRGELTYKEITGDFVVTTEVQPSNRAGTGAPQTLYSLSGIMVRTPRTMTSPAEWTPGGQNYVFLSLGAASNPGQFQFEVKTTLNSVSTLSISEGTSRAEIQVARIGTHLIMLRRSPGQPWQVHRRYNRPDMPTTLQAGLTVYTDWNTCERIGYQNQNTQVLTNGAALLGGGVVSGANPDLRAAFDYVRYARPQIPPQLQGANFSNASQVSDAQLLVFLGSNANRPGGSVVAPSFTSTVRNGGGMTVTASVEADRSYRLQQMAALPGEWMDVTNFVSEASTFTFESGNAAAASSFFRLASP